ncbi:hypothetical protein A8W25_22255 [Streptomyces sp. ERV7]|uniref:hypothetical protein n=1 Tax=Streptomyces sp. ERV7 TaxID=1322334 RepID=UPI0007F4DD51|nr:hypothetical protein [Streptomyces sp. ERV7]OAR22379.1 hypothetical protein A8W25_22255 [Streptomyces sp. ERV7]
MNARDEQPQSFEEQRAAVEQRLAEQGVEATRAPDPAQARAALDALLDDRPQLAALALNLLTAAVESGAVVTEGRTWTSGDIVRTVRRSRRDQMLAERSAAIAEQFTTEQQPAALALAQLAETRQNGEKAKKAMPFMIRQADAVEIEAPDIARLLDVTPSHVYAVLRKLREDPGAVAVGEEWRDQLLTELARHEEEAQAARRRKAEEHGEHDLADEDL